uniref:Uncharacterized protein n=1 Tax=Mesocestoides corti TaxID=53468 RepID=A0A5K3EQR9_MESCO
MSYIYILVPISLSLILFMVTVGYLLIIKYKANHLLKALRLQMITERCGQVFVQKRPDVTYGREPFVGIYRESVISSPQKNYGESLIHQHSMQVQSGDAGFGSLHSLNFQSRNNQISDVIEIPLRPYVHSSSSSGGTSQNFYDKFRAKEYKHKHRSSGPRDDRRFGTLSPPESEAPPLPPPRNGTLSGIREYNFVDEFGVANAYNLPEYRNFQSKQPPLS